MPLLLDDPEPDLIGLGEGLSLTRLPGNLAFDAIARDSRLTERVGGFLTLDSARRFDRHMQRMTGVSDALDPETATERYGIEGVLKFDKPVLPVEAAWQQRQAQEREYRDYVLANSDIGPLSALSAGIWGTLTDPVSWPLMFAPELLGIAKAGQALFAGARGAGTLARASRLGTAGRFALEGAVEGAVGGAIYEAANYSLRQFEGDDYSGGDALRNILLGAVLGGSVKAVLGAALPPGATGETPSLAQMREADDIDALPDTELPEAVAAMPEDQRAAAAAMAIDRMADDAPVDLSPVIERQRAVDLRQLNEVAGAPAPLALREVGEDLAVTTRGTEIPVRYAVVEIGDLVTSHDDDLVRNADYPAPLQPRDRGERAGSIAANRELQGRLHPRLLLEGPAAEVGSAIVSRDGVVESGNGRLIAMRRDMAEGGAFWDRYQAALKAAGYPVEGMDAPVLVRVRDSVLTGEQRAALTLELNPPMTERMGPREQAMADARAMPDDVLEKLAPGAVDGEGNRPFARAFLDRLAPDQLNSLVDAKGRLSLDGAQRLRAAVTALAYGDGGLLEAVFEQADGPLKTIGLALADAAPAWARMRADMARGLTPPEVDITGNIRAAVDLIRMARDQRMSLPRLLAERLGQTDAFTSGLAVETEALLRLFYDNAAMTRPRDPALVAAFLDDYARQAQAKTPGPDLFGDTHDGAARQILENLGQQLARHDGQFGDILTRLRAEQAAPDIRPDPAGHAGDVLFGPGREDGGGGGRGRGEGAEGLGGPVEGQPKARAKDLPALEELGPDRAQAILQPVIDAARNAPGSNKRVMLARVSDWMEALLGERFKHPGRFKHTVESGHLEHIIKKHGNPKIETARGQVAVTWDDFKLLPQALADPERVIFGLTSEDGHPSVATLSYMGNGSWAIIEQIRGQRGQLNLTSMWKFPTRIDADAFERRLYQNAQDAGGGDVKIVDRPAQSTPASAPEPAAAAPAAGGPGRAFIEADPELKELADDLDALLAREGLDGAPARAAEDPDVIAEAMRAAADCLLDAAEDL